MRMHRASDIHRDIWARNFLLLLLLGSHGSGKLPDKGKFSQKWLQGEGATSLLDPVSNKPLAPHWDQKTFYTLP